MNYSKRTKQTLSFISSVTLISVLVTSCGAPNRPAAQLENTNPGENPGTVAGPPPYPNFRGQDFHGEKNFANLINKYAEGKVDPTPWAGFWWPYTQNGIASGRVGDGGGSPAGKYDAARGGTTNAQNWEVKHHGATVPQVQSWWGHCNGWCAAAALYKEPRENVKVNGIIFNIGDIKGLLTEAGMSVSADFFGERIDNWDNTASPKYWDTIPNQYFLVLTNYIGRLKQAVLIDRYTGYQVWNQPLAGYRFEYPKKEDYLGNTPEAPNIYRILLNSKLWWMDDGVPPDVQTPPFNFQDDEAVIASRELRLEVWLDGPVVFDANGKIQSSGNVVVTRQGDTLVGGVWKTDNGSESWPDYMWVPYAIVKPTEPDQDYVNPEVDIDWLKAHILVPGGADDTTVTPRPIVTPPVPRPSGFPPFPMPTSFPTGFPWPNPTSTSGPGPRPTSVPFPWPSNQ